MRVDRDGDGNIMYESRQDIFWLAAPSRQRDKETGDSLSLTFKPVTAKDDDNQRYL